MYSEELHEYWKAHLGDSSWKHMNLSVSQDSMRDLLDEIERLKSEIEQLRSTIVKFHIETRNQNESLDRTY
ncbi:MAG: hypothetical protein FD147_2566 [Chloroflexi bacterium]|nr:MAG: hypothetical protein FD147_2566 [Chloroflexota bacterium]